MAIIKSFRAESDVSSITPFVRANGAMLAHFLCKGLETSALKNSLWWSIFLINLVDNTNYPVILSHQCSTTVSLENCPFTIYLAQECYQNYKNKLTHTCPETTSSWYKDEIKCVLLNDTGIDGDDLAVLRETIDIQIFSESTVRLKTVTILLTTNKPDWQIDQENFVVN